MAKAIDEITAICGKDAVLYDEKGLREYAVDGKQPRLACFPDTIEKVCRVMEVAQQSGLVVIPRGGGTRVSLGLVCREYDTALCLERLNSFIEHDPGNFSASAQAGMTLKDFQAKLKAEGQFFPLDSPYPERSTLGGITAANSWGPQRLLYGSARDLVIGIKAVLPGGNVISSGAKTAKQVAGYDLTKLFIGAIGTLGVIVEVGMRLVSLPEARATVIRRFSNFQEIGEAFGSPLLSRRRPAALVVMRHFAEEQWLGAIDFVGIEEVVEESVGVAQGVLSQPDKEAEVLSDTEAMNFWEKIARQAVAGDDQVVLEVAVPIVATLRTIASVEKVLDLDAEEVTLVAHPGLGIINLRFPFGEKGVEGTLDIIRRVRRGANRRGGSVEIESAPAEVKEKINVWGVEPDGLDIMRRLKERFDPTRVLSPGRFVGRI
jgi:glycolate oxidase FAD binding subunit